MSLHLRFRWHWFISLNYKNVFLKIYHKVIHTKIHNKLILFRFMGWRFGYDDGFFFQEIWQIDADYGFDKSKWCFIIEVQSRWRWQRWLLIFRISFIYLLLKYHVICIVYIYYFCARLIVVRFFSLKKYSIDFVYNHL